MLIAVALTLLDAIRNDDIKCNMGARTIFFATFAFRLFESASKLATQKHTNVSCNIPVVNFVAQKTVVLNRPV